MLLDQAHYADAGRLIAETARAFLPAERMDVADHAAAHRWLANAGGGYVGRWQHHEAPYLVGPMRALASDLYGTTAIVGPGQCGKTAVAENWLLSSVDRDPADFLWYMQTDLGLESYVKGRINPMIEMHDGMRTRLGPMPIDNSLHFKRFENMKAEFLSATGGNLVNKSAPRIVADEIDAYAESLGDVKVVLDVRRQTFGSASMLLALSHPDRAKGLDPDRGHWTAGIMSIFADSTRFLWYWPCPQCGMWSSPLPTAARVMTIEYPVDAPLDAIEREARLVCPNGCAIEDHQRREMNIAALQAPQLYYGYLGQGQEIREDGTVRGDLIPNRTAGFWIHGAMSPFVGIGSPHGGLGTLARARVKAERDFLSASDAETEATLRQVMVKQWGVPYRRPREVGTLDATELADRAEHGIEPGTVPDGVRFLTLAIDIQIAHFEWLLRGWGVSGESWVIETGRVAGDPATSPEDWDRLLELIGRAWPLADKSGRAMKLRGAIYDSHGAPGVTAQAYEAWTRWRRKKSVRFLGTAGGRHCWSVIPSRGLNKPNAPRLQVTYPDTARAANRRSGAGNVPVLSFNPNLFKDDLNGQFARAAGGPWAIHVPASFRSREKPHVWFEQVTAEERSMSGTWSKKTNTTRNEALDLMVLTHACARLHGVGRIDWSRPPVWAAPWDSNALIVAGSPPAMPGPAEGDRRSPDAPPAPVSSPAAAPQPQTSAPAAKPASPKKPVRKSRVTRSNFMGGR